MLRIYLFCSGLLLLTLFTQAQNVGIGTVNPQARLHVTDSSVLFQGPTSIPVSTLFGPPASGEGVRFMWYPQKAALRAGYVSGNYWDKDNIGVFSVSLGYNTKATANFSTSMGDNTTASGPYSTSMGRNTTASGDYSTSMGYGTSASANFATGMGYGTIASADYSTSMGAGTLASGRYSTSMGEFTTASGNTSTSMGAYTIAFGNYSTSMGYHTKSNSANSLAIGIYNDTTNTNRLFEIGNGTAYNARRNALTVLTNGNVGIGTITPASPLHIASSGGVVFGSAAGNVGALQLSTTEDVSPVSARMSFGTDGSGWQFRLAKNTAGTVSDLLAVVDNGNVGIGTISPSQKLHVLGNILASGTITPSDFRYKTDIKKLEDPLGKLAAINGVSYYYKSGSFPEMGFSNSRQVGVIAQEVESVLPEVVVTDANGYKSVDYAKLVPLLIEGMKAQQEHIRQQDEKMAQLLKRIEVLEQSKSR